MSDSESMDDFVASDGSDFEAAAPKKKAAPKASVCFPLRRRWLMVTARLKLHRKPRSLQRPKRQHRRKLPQRPKARRRPPQMKTLAQRIRILTCLMSAVDLPLILLTMSPCPLARKQQQQRPRMQLTSTKRYSLFPAVLVEFFADFLSYLGEFSCCS